MVVSWFKIGTRNCSPDLMAMPVKIDSANDGVCSDKRLGFFSGNGSCTGGRLDQCVVSCAGGIEGAKVLRKGCKGQDIIYLSNGSSLPHATGPPSCD